MDGTKNVLTTRNRVILHSNIWTELYGADPDDIIPVLQLILCEVRGVVEKETCSCVLTRSHTSDTNTKWQ